MYTESKKMHIDIVPKPSAFGVNPAVAKKSFPLWKVEYTEGLRGRDGGSEWADPFNDVIKTHNIVYFIRKSLAHDWEKFYDESVGEFSYATHEAAITLTKLQERWDMFDNFEKTVMFECDGNMFKQTYYFENSKCVCGESINDLYYNDYEEDNSIKLDLLKSYVYGYEKDCLVFSGGAIYMNGELLMTKKQLLEEHLIQWYQAQMLYPDIIRKQIMELFPTAMTYHTSDGSGSFGRKPIEGLAAKSQEQKDQEEKLEYIKKHDAEATGIAEPVSLPKSENNEVVTNAEG